MTSSQDHAQTAHSSRRPAHERRSTPRLGLALSGRFLLDGAGDCDFVTANLSSDGAFLRASAAPGCGTQIICYLDQLGRIPAEVIWTAPDGFAVRFEASAPKRAKLAGQLARLADPHAPTPEPRTFTGLSAEGQAVIHLPNGDALACDLTDISPAGAAFEAHGTPPFVGERVQTGVRTAEVVRVEGRRFAARFLHGAEAEPAA